MTDGASMSKERRISAFFGQQNKGETAETSTATDEAEPEEDQSSELTEIEIARAMQSFNRAGSKSATD